jgi:hypothetical protein
MVYTTPEIVASFAVDGLLGAAIGFTSCKNSDPNTKCDNG